MARIWSNPNRARTRGLPNRTRTADCPDEAKILDRSIRAEKPRPLSQGRDLDHSVEIGTQDHLVRTKITQSLQKLEYHHVGARIMDHLVRTRTMDYPDVAKTAR